MKLVMCKTLSIILIVSVFLGSCKKESSSSESNYYLKFKMNGNWITWKKVVGELGPDLADPSKTDFGLTANNDTQTELVDMSIQVDGSNFTTRTYTPDNYFMPVMYVKNAN